MLEKNKNLILSLMIIIPTAYVIPRGIHILLSICWSLVRSPRKFCFDKPILLLSITLYLVCIIALFNGLLRGNDISSVFLLYAIWPFIFALLSSYMITKKDFYSLEKTIIYSSVIGCILVLIGVISILFIGKTFFFEEIFKVQLGFVFGMPKFGSQFLPILCFSIPFTFFWMLNKSGSSQRNAFLLFIFMSIFSLASGRSVFLLMLIALGFFAFIHLVIFSHKTTGIYLKYALFFALILSLLYILYPESFYTSIDIFFKKLFGINDNTLGSGRRLEQFNNLYPQILDNPIFGLGLNATELPESNVIAFELTYLQVIFNFGILGFSILLFGNFIVFFYLFIFFYQRDSINIISPWIYGYLIYLICALTNPILLKFDRLWIVWVPIFLYLNRRAIIRAK